MDNNLPSATDEALINSDQTIQTSVRRLSLFDTLSSDDTIDNEVHNETSFKSEPILASPDETIKNDETIEENEINNVSEKEFEPEEGNSEEIEDDFNQENEEELLDIPTFLRRQAN